MGRRSRRVRYLLFCSLFLGPCLACVLYVTAPLIWRSATVASEPTVSSRIAHSKAELKRHLQTQELTRRGLECFTLLWLFGVGASIGSFLNVVIYRTPRGMSPSQGGSRCPYCRQAILARDNIPIVSWLCLGGRCRRCRLPISGRYPLVEGLIGGFFASVAFVDLLHGAHGLGSAGLSYFPPLLEGLVRGGPRLLLLTTHLLLGCLLFAHAMIAYDRLEQPRSIMIVSVFTGWLCAATPLCFLYFGQSPPSHLPSPPGWLLSSWGVGSNGTLLLLPGHVQSVVVNAVLGGLLGLVCGKLLDLFFASRACWFLLLVIGLSLGWQFVLCIALLATVLVAVFNTVRQAGNLPGEWSVELTVWATWWLFLLLLPAWQSLQTGATVRLY